MNAMTALIGFTAWTLALVMFIVLWRGIEILRGKPANSWGRDTAIPVPGLVRRAEHAHLNALENLPIFAVIVLAAAALGKTAAVEATACWVLYTRIAQSLIHLIGVSPLLVLGRATFYFVQLGLFIYMLWSLLA
ncbi:MAPEG family protein [Solimonas terrae]|uniref:MAPEG family protein n=1 Tax=Solimonas terrae TaxID=1396819 RepID=A0A6M2BTV9_9GAMM|nr:MAPEG family protein [Solimonas terrae]NGY05429.1 MAPEG family protein [Solimonas terrae]